MNIQHSSRTDMWFTPLDLLPRIRHVLGTIDLDPASCAEANDRIAAHKYYDEYDDGLQQDWGENLSIFLNPPGGRRGKESMSILFWQKLMQTEIKHAIYMGFSLEQLQVSQDKGVPPIGDFMFCTPSKRIRFYYPYSPDKSSPSHGNIIVYVPGSIDMSEVFYDTFNDLGTISVPYVG